MSHFSVAVITKNKPTRSDIAELLAPYDENIEVPLYVDATRQEIIDSKRKNLERFKDSKLYKSYLENPTEFERKNSPADIDYVKNQYPQLCAMTDDELLNTIIADDPQNFDKEGNHVTTYNPKSKWDWYSFGGRWSGEIPTSEVEYSDSDQMPLSVVDWGYETSNSAYIASHPDIKEKYEKLITDGDGWFKPAYFKERYPDLDSYIKTLKTFTTYAVVTPDGEWHEPGRMGWFGMSNATSEDERNWVDIYYNDYIKPYLNDGYITMVDCHI